MRASCAAQCTSNCLMGLEQTFTDVRVKEDSGDRAMFTFYVVFSCPNVYT
jgi:hypothetical protein